MENYEQIGKNIRSLRLAYGESQEELGQILHVTKSAVSNYERGKRQPTEILIAISEHFGLTYEEFINSDLTSIGKINIEPEYFLKYIQFIFPIATTNEAIKNQNFCQAYDIHQQTYDLIKNQDPNGFLKTWDCILIYMNALDDERSESEAAANIIGLYYLTLMILKGPITIRNNNWAAITQFISRNPKIKRTIADIDSTYENDSNELINDLQDSELTEMIFEFIRIIKRTKLWADLADYYLALRYILLLVDNGLSQIINIKIGMEMLDTLTIVGNEFAMAYLSLFSDTENQ